MKIEIVSTFSPAYYDKVGKFFIESCLKFLSPTIKLSLYVDDINIPKKENFNILNLEQVIPELIEFKKRNQDRPQEGWRMGAIGFSYKVYATCHAARNSDADILIWLDADTELQKPLDENYFSKFLPEDKDVGFLGRDTATETGFLVFNLKNPNCKYFLNQYQWHYDSDEIFKFKEWHDGYVFDRVKDKLTAEGKLNALNISPSGATKNHFNFLHNRSIVHHKGQSNKSQRKTGESKKTHVKSFS